MPDQSPEKNKPTVLDVGIETIKKMPRDKIIHFLGSLAGMIVGVALFCVLGIGVVAAVIGMIGISIYGYFAKEIFDTGIINILALPTPFNYILVAILCVIIVIVAKKWDEKKISTPVTLALAPFISSLILLEIFGPKIRPTGFSIDDIIADGLGGLLGLGIVVVAYYFYRLIKYYTIDKPKEEKALKKLLEE
jgi:hypothetical protein